MDVLLSVVAEEQYRSCAGGSDTAMCSAGMVGSSYPTGGNGTSNGFMGGDSSGRVGSTQSWGSSGQAVRGASEWYASASRPQASWGGGAGDRSLQYGGPGMGQTPRAHSGYANSSYDHSYQIQRTQLQQQQHHHQSPPQRQPYTSAAAAAHNDVASRRQLHSTTTTTPPRLPERNGYVNHQHQFTNGMSYAASSGAPGSAGKKRPRVEDWGVGSPVTESRRSESHSDIQRRLPPQSSPASPDAAPRHASQQGTSVLEFPHTSQGWQVERHHQQQSQQQQQQQQQQRQQQLQQQQLQQQQQQQRQQQQQEQQQQRQQQRWYVKQEEAHDDEGGEVVSLNYLLKAPAFARRPSSPPPSPPPPAMEPPVMQPPPREMKKRMTVELGSKEWYDDVRARAMGFLKREVDEEKAVGLIQGETKLRLDVGLGGRVLKDWEGCGRIGCEAPARPRSRYCSNTCGILEAQTMLWHALSDYEHEEEQRMALSQHVPAGIGSTTPLLLKRESASFSPIVDEDVALRADGVLGEMGNQSLNGATVVVRDGETKDGPMTIQGGLLCDVKEKQERRVDAKVECGVSGATSNDGGISVTCVCCRAELDPDELEVHLRERCLVHGAYARTRVADD